MWTSSGLGRVSQKIHHGLLNSTQNQREQAKLQWLQNPSQVNGDILNNEMHETSRNV
jgi:hypothetical protein